MIIPGMNSDTAVDPVDLQEELMRSADIFLAGVTTAANKLRRDGAPISQSMACCRSSVNERYSESFSKTWAGVSWMRWLPSQRV
jgi:hypothetical protein